LCIQKRRSSGKAPIELSKIGGPASSPLRVKLVWPPIEKQHKNKEDITIGPDRSRPDREKAKIGFRY